MGDYRYLFPYEKIPSGSRVLIYGAGDVGHDYLTQILMTGYCECIGFLDRAYDKCPSAVVPIFPPEAVADINFDYVVIAMKTAVYVESIRRTLEQYGVPSEKIVYVGARKQVPVCMENVDSIAAPEQKMAFRQEGRIPVAMRLSAALGDLIVRRKVFDELVRIESNCVFDIYAPYASDYIMAVYGNHPNLNCIIDDAGVLYQKYMHRYSLAISSINPRLTVDFWDKEIGKKSPRLLAMVSEMVENIKAYGLGEGNLTQNFIHYGRMRYRGMDYYASYSQYSHFFDKDNRRIEIPLQREFEEKYKELHFGKYITVNCETGISPMDDACLLPKQWPVNSFVTFIRLFKEAYPDIAIVQLGATGKERFPNVDYYLFGQNLELVKYVLKNALLHVDIEGGLVHLATQLGTKCAVLFGPTPVDFFGYRQNINIVAPKCSGCHGLYEDLNHCAKEQTEPECMRSITPEMVMDAIAEYMRTQS